MQLCFHAVISAQTARIFSSHLIGGFIARWGLLHFQSDQFYSTAAVFYHCCCFLSTALQSNAKSITTKMKWRAWGMQAGDKLGEDVYALWQLRCEKYLQVEPERHTWPYTVSLINRWLTHGKVLRQLQIKVFYFWVWLFPFIKTTPQRWQIW